MGNKKNGMPDRWEIYSKIGGVVEGTKFISFKVPLKPDILSSVPEGVDRNWTLEDLISSSPSPGLELVIDLTFTTRYYDSNIFRSNNIKHVTFFTKGHEIPNN